jgi:hypothetical protein
VKNKTSESKLIFLQISLNLADTQDENEAVDVDIEVNCVLGNQEFFLNPMTFQTVKIHPQYSTLSKHHDIALLKLKTPVKFTDVIKPVCLSSNEIHVPKNLTVTGFGSTEAGRSALSERLLKGTIQEFSKDECKRKYKENGKDLIDGQYCANSYNEIDACQVSLDMKTKSK